MNEILAGFIQSGMHGSGGDVYHAGPASASGLLGSPSLFTIIRRLASALHGSTTTHQLQLQHIGLRAAWWAVWWP